MAKTVLIVEDERAIVEILKFNLKREGYETLEALDGETGLLLAQTKDPDLILLDVMLPKMSGFDICKTLRGENRTTPIIMLTAREEEMDKVFGLETGADDYMTKPFSMKELMARVKANIRRRSMEYASAQASGTANTVEANGLCLNPETYQVTKNGAPVDLTQKEYDLLSYLIRERGKVFSREDLMQRVWNYDYYGDMRTVDVTVRNLEKYLGKEKYSQDMRGETDEVGIVRGLAWTSVGGDTLEIEVNVMPGKGEFQLTGQLGDVMKESAQTGISYIRSVGGQYDIPAEFFQKNDIHIHIPEGAVPKDGPSAGITMATAMLSAITGTPVRADVAMTGEITLRGRVLPIGGLKEKLLAAKNAGVRTVCVPKKNEKDVEEISGEIKKGLEIVYVETMEQVLRVAFCEKKE